MKSNLLLLPTLALALQGISLGDATVPDPVTGDIFLAFRATDGQGADTSYIVDIGADTIYRNAVAGSSFSLSAAGNIGADLIATYGANWTSRVDLHWAVFGARSSASSSVYASRERSAANVVSTPWPALGLDSRNSTSSQISSVVNGIGGYRSSAATANSPVGALQPNSATASSYAFQVGTAGTSDFGSLSQWGSIEGDFGGGVSGSVLDFYRLSGSTTAPVQNLGSFTIDSTGLVKFIAATAAPSNVDTDGDGWTDADEATAGTDPNNPSDFFHVQQLVKTGATSTVLRFQTAAGRTYQVQFSETLAADSWTVVGTYTAGATGSLYDFTDSDATHNGKTRGFYRIQVSQ